MSTIFQPEMNRAFFGVAQAQPNLTNAQVSRPA